MRGGGRRITLGTSRRLSTNQAIVSQNEFKKIYRAKHAKLAKEIQKSPFHPPLTKGERGGFEKPWCPLRLCGTGHALRSLRETQCYSVFSSFQNFKYVWLGFHEREVSGFQRCP